MKKRIIIALAVVFLAPLLPAQSPALVLTLPAGTNDAACSATVTRACMKEFAVKVGGVEKGRITYVQGTLSYTVPSMMLGTLSPGTAIAVDVVFLDEYGATKQQAYKTITVPASYLPSFLSGGSLAWGQTQSGGTNSGGTIGSVATPDITAPVITPNPPTISSGIGSVTNNSAIITVSTNELAVCRLRYGTSTGVYGTTLAYESVQAFTHPIVIGASPVLSANTQYFGVVDCKDGVPNTSTTSEWSFTTQAASPSDPLYGSSSTGALVPAKKYLMEVASYSGSGTVMTVTVTSTFDPTGLNTNEKVKVCLAADCSGYMTASATVDTVASTPTSTSFTFSSSSTASGTGGWVVYMPVWNDGDVWTASPGSTPVRRLCNFEGASSYRIPYSSWYGVSPSGTMVLILHIGGGGWAVLNVSSCTFVRTVAQTSSAGLTTEDQNPRWVPAGTTFCPGATDCIIWFQYNSGVVKKWDVVNSSSASTWDTISGCGSGITLDRTGDLDTTSDMVAIRCNTGSGYEYFVYTISSKTKGASYTTASGAADFTQVLDNGNFVVVWQATGSGNEQGTQYYNGSTGARIHQVAPVSPHGTARSFSDGKIWFVGYDGGNTMCGVSSLFARDVVNLVTQCLETGGNPGTDRTLGITSASSAHPDFILYSYQGPGGYPITVQGNAWQANWTRVYQAEVGLIKWPGTGSITNFRLAHHWQRTLDNGSGGYNNLPHATMNRNGTVIVFNSWDVCGSTPTACVPKGTVGSTSYPMGFGVMKPFDSGNP